MFSDIVGYTSMTQRNEALALELLEEHRKILRPIFGSHGGQVVKTIGDAFLVEFKSALDAVACSVEIQRTLAERNKGVTSLRRLELRIGIHVGDVVKIEGDVYGDAVNVASRIEKLADPGGIAVSSNVYEQVKSNIMYSMEEMGRFVLKNVENPAQVYRVVATWRGVTPTRHESERTRLAVLPLRNIGEERSDEFLAEGLTEELISCFITVAGLKVVARATMMKYRGTEKSVSEIGTELKVGTVLVGSVRRYENRLRVTVQLVETSTEEYLWSQTYDREVDDVLKIQQDIADKTVSALRNLLGREAGQLEWRSVTTSAEAYILYLKGRYHLARHSESEVRQAIDLFRQATELDPRFAASFAMLAQCHLFLGFFGFVPPLDAFNTAKPFIERALELDRDLHVAHMLMGRYLMDSEWNWSGAEAEFKRAIELAPNSAEAHYRYALLLHDLEKHEEAVAEARVAEELDPLSVAVNQVSGTVLYYARRYGEAIVRFQRALEIEPGAVLARTNLGLAYFQTGNVEKGVAEVQKAVEMDPRNSVFRVDLCYVYARSGRGDEALGVLRETESMSESMNVPPVALAGMHACLGHEDQALDLLEKAYEEHSPYLSSLRVERWFDTIRTSDRFTSLLKRVHLV